MAKQKLYKGFSLFQWICLMTIYSVFIISFIVGFIKKDEVDPYNLDACINRYIFVYEDLCNLSNSFYIKYPGKEIVRKQLIQYDEPEDYNLYEERCIEFHLSDCNGERIVKNEK